MTSVDNDLVPLLGLLGRRFSELSELTFGEAERLVDPHSRHRALPPEVENRVRRIAQDAAARPVFDR